MVLFRVVGEQADKGGDLHSRHQRGADVMETEDRTTAHSRRVRCGLSSSLEPDSVAAEFQNYTRYLVAPHLRIELGTRPRRVLVELGFKDEARPPLRSAMRVAHHHVKGARVCNVIDIEVRRHDIRLGMESGRGFVGEFDHSNVDIVILPSTGRREAAGVGRAAEFDCPPPIDTDIKRGTLAVIEYVRSREQEAVASDG